MSKKRTIFALVMVLVLSLAMITGCGGTSDEEYLSWTGEEWTAAEQEDKVAALKVVMLKVQPEYEDQEEALTTAVEAMIPSIDALFEASPDMSLQDLVEQVQGMTTDAGEAAEDTEKAEDKE